MPIHKDQDRIEKTVDLAAPVAQVWRALTDPGEFGAWFRVRLDNGFAVGETTTGTMTYPGHEHVKWVSVTEAMDHEHLFSFSWSPSAVDPDTEYGETAKVLVEFRLNSIESGTRLVITESGFQQFPEPKRLEILRSSSEGWDTQVDNVKSHVES